MPPGEGSSGLGCIIYTVHIPKKKNGGGHEELMALSVSTSIFITELQRVLQERITLLF